MQPAGEVSQSSIQCILARSKSSTYHPAVSCRSLPKHISDTPITQSPLQLGLYLGQIKVSVESVRRLINKLGCGLTEVKKAMYINGHERPDVVENCKAFLEKMKESEQ